MEFHAVEVTVKNHEATTPASAISAPSTCTRNSGRLIKIFINAITKLRPGAHIIVKIIEYTKVN